MAGDVIDAEVTTKDLAPVERPAALSMSAENRGLALIEKMIETGLTAENAAAFQTLCTTAKEMRADAAREAFFVAKAALQAEMPHVSATKAIVDDKGRTRAKWAPYEEVMQVIRPYLVKHGFSVSFDCRTEPDGKRMTAICIVSHVRGHSERNEFSVHTSAPPGCSAAQGDGSTMTYAQRYALLAAFGIAVDKDTDARMEGATISAKEARELRDGVEATKISVPTFLKLAGAQEFASIREGKLDVLRKVIADARARTAKAEPPAPAPDADPAQRDKVWGYVRAFAKARANAKAGGATFDGVVGDLNKKVLGLPPSTAFADWTPADIPKALKSCEAKATKEGIDVSPYMAGAPEFQPAPKMGEGT